VTVEEKYAHLCDRIAKLSEKLDGYRAHDDSVTELTARVDTMSETLGKVLKRLETMDNALLTHRQTMMSLSERVERLEEPSVKDHVRAGSDPGIDSVPGQWDHNRDDSVSERTLKMMDESMESLKNGKAGEPVDPQVIIKELPDPHRDKYIARDTIHAILRKFSAEDLKEMFDGTGYDISVPTFKSYTCKKTDIPDGVFMKADPKHKPGEVFEIAGAKKMLSLHSPSFQNEIALNIAEMERLLADENEKVLVGYLKKSNPEGLRRLIDRSRKALGEDHVVWRRDDYLRMVEGLEDLTMTLDREVGLMTPTPRSETDRFLRQLRSTTLKLREPLS